MMLLKADRKTESGALPSEEALAAMAKYNEELITAGVLLDAAGLQPSSKGARVTFEGGKPHVTDGPFVETKELLAGYWMIQVKSKDEAIAWASHVPFGHIPQTDGTGQIELRQVYELEDFEPGQAVDRHVRLQERMAGARSQR